MARAVTITFLGNTRDLVGAMNTAERRSSKFGNTLRRIGKAAVYGFATAAVAAAGAAYKMAEAAAEDETAARKLALSLKNATGATKGQIAAVEDWILQTSLATGVTDDELRPALAKLAVATGDVGEAQKLLAVGMDVAAGTGKSLESVTSALQKAQNGSLGGLARLGIATKDAAGETKTFADLQTELAAKFKGQTAAAAETTTGQFNRMKVAFSEAGEELGYKLLPYATRFATWLTETGIPAIERFVGWLRDKLGPVFSRVKEWFSGATQDGGKLSGAMDDMSVFVDDVRRAWKGLSPFLSEAARTIFPLLVEQVKGTARNLRLMADAAIWMWNNAFGPALKSSTKAFAILLESVADTLDILGSIPGAPAWIGKTADKAHVAAARINDVSNAIRKIPPRKEVTIVVTTVRRGHAEGGGSGLGPQLTPRAGGKGGLSNAAKHILDDLIEGVKISRKKFEKALDAVAASYKAKRDKLKQLITERNDFVKSFADSFRSSVFGEDFTDPETGASTATPKALIEWQRRMRDKAIRLRDAVKKLIGMGVSRDVLLQMASSGQSGQDAIEALATGSGGDISEFNGLNAETMAALTDAGTAVGGAVFGGDIEKARADAAATKEVRDLLASINAEMKGDKHGEIKIQGTNLLVVFRRLERALGKQLLVT